VTELEAIKGADPSSAREDAPRLDRTSFKVPAAPAGFNTHDAGWVRFEYPATARQQLQPLIDGADGFRADLAARLGQPVLQRVLVRIGRTPAEMATLAPEGAPFPRYASGVAYSQLGLVLLTIQPVHPNQNHDLSEVFRHELAHVALHDAVRGNWVPRWFNEGLAVYVSGEGRGARLRALWIATVSQRLIPLERLDREFPADEVAVEVAYAQSADVVRYLLGAEDRARFLSLVARTRQGQGFDSALADAYGVNTRALEFQWKEDVSRRYTFWPIVFSGGLIWVAALVLIVLAWRRRKRRDKVTLAHWAREEALEDALRMRAPAHAQALAVQHGHLGQQGQHQSGQPEQQGRLHLVLARPSRPVVIPPPRPREAEIPQVEHNGRWHTLH
jgi:hypothetical protein